MKFTVCPFCGVASESPHDSEEACIRALQSEIARTREILTHVAAAVSPSNSDPHQEEDSQRT